MAEADGVNEVEQEEGARSLARRALLTRGGGLVAAGVAGAGVMGVVSATAASAATGDPVLQGDVNDAVATTELDAAANTTPALILTNTGVDTTNNGAGPTLRLTPSTASGVQPTASTVGGDLTTTSDATLWFTHDFGANGGIFPAPVLTEATGNVYAALEAPSRVLDTRSAALRKNIVNPTGNLDSTGRLKAGKTIALNLDGLVFFAEAVFANLTVTKTASAGFVTVWSGATALPNASTINFGNNATLSNFFSCGLSEFSSTITNVIAIHAAVTTHIIVDVTAFTLPGFEYANFAPALTSNARSARLQRAQQAIRANRKS
ncbi:MAG TPA: hypothetical protein VGI58_10345 [Streptosporangiaceae bacterium]|jgi:hypothetical protein